MAVFNKFFVTDQNLLMVAKNKQEDEPSADSHELEGYMLNTNDIVFCLFHIILFLHSGLA